MKVICPHCRESSNFDPHQFKCDCGSAWEPFLQGDFLTEKIKPDRASLWRYQDIFNLTELNNIISLGTGWTPLISGDWMGRSIRFKLEYFAPTGSFKDRGTEVEANVLHALATRKVVEDSSGNAGSSLAAFAARLGMQATIFSPDSASEAKLSQIRRFGATLELIPGPRIRASEAVLAAVSKGAVYASHAYNPAYLLGQQTFAWEIWEQMGNQKPDALVIPTGQGGLMLGAWLGFQRLYQAGIIESLPRIYAVQAKNVSPVFHAFKNQHDHIKTETEWVSTIAEGLATSNPVRGNRILEGIRETNGAAIAVSDEEIRNAYYDLARIGLYVEPTSAVVAAALPQVFEKEEATSIIVVGLTGSGLKSSIKE